MSFEGIVGQDAPIAFLRRTLSQGRLAHAYLFTGPSGVGKAAVARFFAQGLLCERPVGHEACGSCGSCRRIAANAHPDVMVVRPEGEFIKVDAIRDARRFLGLRGFESTKKVLIIDEADRLNEESANALLKSLEEPAPDTLIIVIAPRRRAVLRTIASRCHRVAFRALSPERLADILIKRHGMDPGKARYLARAAEGSVGAALALDQAQFYALKDRFVGGASEKTGPWEQIVNSGGRERARSQEKFLEALNVLAGWYRDVLVVKAVPGHADLINQDHEETLRKVASRWDAAEAHRRFAVIAAVAEDVRRHANLRLAVARLKAELWT